MSCDVGEATEGIEGGGSAHSPTITSLHLRHSSFSSLANPSVASSTSQLIIQPLRRFIYVTVCSPTLLSPHLRHMHFIYITWQAPHGPDPPPLEPNSRYATGWNWMNIAVADFFKGVVEPPCFLKKKKTIFIFPSKFRYLCYNSVPEAVWWDILAVSVTASDVTLAPGGRR